MIIKGGKHNNAGNLARYLLRCKEGEKAFLMDIRESVTENITEALTDWEIAGRSLTKGDAVLYHSYIRLPKGEAMHEAQWFETIQRLEEQLGLTNCGRAVIGHNGPDGLHVHIAWSRFDPVTGKLASLSNDRKAHHEIARAAEKEFGLAPVESKPERIQRKRRLSDREIRALKDRGINEERLQKIVRAAWDATDSGEEMKVMLGALGANIQRGDRRDFVIEYKGLKMNPVRLLDDVNTAQFRDRMKDAEFEKEREKPPGESLFGRKARQTLQQQFDNSIANDMAHQPAKSGFRKKRRRGSEPRLRPKFRFKDPGI